jgi:hypothetical protein
MAMAVVARGRRRNDAAAEGSGEENSGDQAFHGALQRGCSPSTREPAIGYGENSLQMLPYVQTTTKSVMKIPLAFSVIFYSKIQRSFNRRAS